MTTPNQRSAQNALNLVRPIMARLDPARHPEDLAADLIEGWNGTEIALRSLLGGSALGGQTLIRELRQREMLSLGQTHALMEFLAARERAGRTDYRPTAADVASARHGFQELESALTGPVTAEGAAALPYTVAPVESTVVTVDARRRNPALMIAVAAIVLALIAVGTWFALQARRGRTDGSVTAAGAELLQAGRRGEARRAFEEAAREHPRAAGPHIYLGRMAREDGDFNRAYEELRRAVELEPGNYLAHREMGSYLFTRGNFELAARFYQNAIERNPEDRMAMGYFACAQARMGRMDAAIRFFDRAGPGDWSSCDPRRQVQAPPVR